MYFYSNMQQLLAISKPNKTLDFYIDCIKNAVKTKMINPVEGFELLQKANSIKDN